MQAATTVKKGSFADAIRAIQEAEFFGPEGAKVLDLRGCNIPLPFMLQASCYLEEAVLMGPLEDHSGNKRMVLLGANEYQIEAFVKGDIVPVQDPSSEEDIGFAWGYTL